MFLAASTFRIADITGKTAVKEYVMSFMFLK